MLKIQQLAVSVNSKPILQDVNLSIKPGEVHVVMGPNGGGKSTLAYTLAGHPRYEVTAGQIQLEDQDILHLSPDERARLGLFLAFQYPVEIPGVSVQQFLRLAYEKRFGELQSVLQFRTHLRALAQELRVKSELLERGLNEGFSGGEKKRVEVLQMAVLQPKYAVLDETDSGLDVDAIQAVATGVKDIVQKHQTGVILITHYQRILKYLQPDFVHVLVDGRVVQSGGSELAEQLEREGYRSFSRKS